MRARVSRACKNVIIYYCSRSIYFRPGHDGIFYYEKHTNPFDTFPVVRKSMSFSKLSTLSVDIRPGEWPSEAMATMPGRHKNNLVFKTLVNLWPLITPKLQFSVHCFSMERLHRCTKHFLT